MKDNLNRPCADCPWRRSSTPGWLGASSAKEFVYRADKQSPMECHMTVDYSQPNWKDDIEAAAEVSYCRGAAQYLVNSWSNPRDPQWSAAVQRASDEAPQASPGAAKYPDIFGWTDEFLAHHDNEMNQRYVAASEARTGHDDSLDAYAAEIERHASMRGSRG